MYNYYNSCAQYQNLASLSWHRWMSGPSSVRKWTQTAWHTLQSLSSSPADRLSGKARQSSCTAPWPGGPNPGLPGKLCSTLTGPHLLWVIWKKERVMRAISHMCVIDKFTSKALVMSLVYFPQIWHEHTNTLLQLQTLKTTVKINQLFFWCLQGIKTMWWLMPKPTMRSTQPRAITTCTPWRSRSR